MKDPFISTPSQDSNAKAHWRVSNIIEVRNNSWDISEISHLIPNSIPNLMQVIPPASLFVKKDSLRWSLDKSGTFSIKAAYNSTHIYSGSICAVNVSWKKLWKIQVPYKYKMLLWNLCHSILPVAATLP